MAERNVAARPEATLHRFPAGRIRERRVLPFDRGDLFDLVANVEEYPLFLPGWRAARILRRTGDFMVVEQNVGFRGLHWRFRTKARVRRPESLEITSDDFPFRRLEIAWRFRPVDPVEPGAPATEVSFLADYALQRSVPGTLVGPLIDEAFERVPDAFEKRARELFGGSVPSG